jgi:hypothetical protein
MKTIRMATVKDDQDYTLCSCGAVKLNRFQCFNGCGLVKYPEFDCLPAGTLTRYAENLQAVIQQAAAQQRDELMAEGIEVL